MTDPSSPPAVRTTVPRSAWNALIVLMAGMFMALLDTTIVNVALPTIRDSLDASRGDAQLDHQRLRAGVRHRADPGGPGR